MMRITCFLFFYLFTMINSTKCMTPKSYPYSGFFNSFNNIITPSFFAVIPNEVSTTYILPYLEGVDQLQLRVTCKAFYTIVVPEISRLKIDLETDSAIDIPQLKNLRTIGIINMLAQDRLKIDKISFVHMNLQGFKNFCVIFKTNKNITALDLSYNDICDDGVKALIEMLKANTTLASLDLSGNNIGSVGKQLLHNSAHKNLKLLLQ